MDIYHNSEKNIKKIEKTFKKGIDKRKMMWYNIKVAARVATSVIENWTTREKYKAKKIVCVLDLEQFKREYYSNKK